MLKDLLKKFYKFWVNLVQPLVEPKSLKLRTYCATVKYKDKINILIYTIKCLLSIKIEK